MDSITDKEIPIYSVNEIGLRAYSSAEIKALSVKEISYPISFNFLAHPNINGLYDPSLGPHDRGEICSTCGQNNIHCPGHMGHIQLELPVYNHVFFSSFFQLLKCTCFSCHRFTASLVDCFVFVSQLEVLEAGYVTEYHSLADNVYSVVKGQDLNNMAILVEAQNITKDFIKKIMENSLKERQTGLSHIELCRRTLIKNFLNEAISEKKCPHCKYNKKTIRQEHHCKITVTSKGASRSLPIKKPDIEVLSHSDDENNLDDIEMVEKEDGEDKENKEKNEVEVNDDISLFFDKSATTKQTLLTPSSAREHLRAVWKVDGHILRKIFQALDSFDDNYCSTDIFFLDVIPVPPCRFRPIAFRSGGFSEHPQSVALGRVIMDNIILKHILKYSADKSSDGDIFDKIDDFAKKAVNTLRGTTVTEKLHYCWQRLQVHVNCLVDADMDRYKLDTKMPGIKQLLEKKTGLFRMHMMGKRVNYACRSVISPDPCLNINEVGIPLVFATRLSFPQPVTPWNVHELRQAVINGPLIHPGALFIENEDGFLTKLNPTDKLQREALAKQLLTPSSTTKSLHGCKKVYRHLKNGDVMLLNRQPTLHKPSIQAHRARVLSGEKTLRMHYANCKAYNADFDGDEMNAHFPQNEMARSEAYSLASTDFQYLAPKDGAPLAGLIQDHMVSGVALTIRGGFFARGDYFNLVFSAISDKYGPIKILHPSIVKPCKLWSGKQVISTVLLNIIPEGKIPLSLDGSAKISEKNWDNGKNRCEENLASLGESKVIIRHGELLQGVLDKGHYGNTPYGLIHCCYELYGGKVAGALLSSLGRLFTAFLKLRGFTLGVADILVTEKANKKRAKIIRKYPKIGGEAVKKALGLAETASEKEMLSGWKNTHFSTDDRGLREIDMCMKRKTDLVQNNIASVCMPGGLEKKFPDNNLQLMVISGAKGSMVNCMQISCLLGQIELEGRRPPQMVNGSTLPSFLPYDASPKAGGFISGRFLTGIRPQEYFFHCMAGREGLVDTAVKTSRSGYLQRCLIKHLEGVIVNYDFTVRDSDSSIIQFYYGEDGLEVQKLPFLEPKLFPFLVQNRESVNQMKVESQSPKYEHFKQLQKKLKKWKKSNDPDIKKRFSSGFLKFCEEEGKKLVKEKDRRRLNENGRLRSAVKLCEAWQKMDQEERKRYQKKSVGCPDPVLSQIWPHEESNVKSERLDYILNKYYKEQFTSMVEELGLTDIFHKDDFESLINRKVHHSYAEPGESVGLLCAQSIGEPSTQMTLNTFHFAGRGEMNMTLGIPRLREILMTASEKIKTPAMNIPVHNTPLAREKAKNLQRKMTKVSLAEVLQSVTTKESMSCENKSGLSRVRTYTIKYILLPNDCYKNKLSMSPADILHYIENEYISNLVDSLKKHLGLARNQKLVDSGNVKKFNLGRKDAGDADGNEDEDDNSIDEGGDGDATAIKQRERLKDTQEYVGEEDEEDLHLTDDDDEDKMNDKLPDEDKELDTTDVADREMLIASRCPEVTEYKYDTKKNLWCEVTLQFVLSDGRLEISSLVQNHATKSIIQSVNGIKQVFLNEQTDKGQSVLQFMTDGINFQEMYLYGDILDLNRLYCNNFKLFSNTYGIEAAARIIQQELKNVFGAYGIQVDNHHLSLLSDFMTFEGSIHPFNRIGIRSNSSPFLKMTYETAMRFLVDSSIHGDVDHLKSPSARLVAGQVVSCGTRSFDILQPIS